MEYIYVNARSFIGVGGNLQTVHVVTDRERERVREKERERERERKGEVIKSWVNIKERITTFGKGRTVDLIYNCVKGPLTKDVIYTMVFADSYLIVISWPSNYAYVVG